MKKEDVIYFLSMFVLWLVFIVGLSFIIGDQQEMKNKEREELLELIQKEIDDGC